MTDKIDCVRLLCSAARIDLDKKMTGDARGGSGTPLSWAIVLSKTEIATLLRLSGAKVPERCQLSLRFSSVYTLPYSYFHFSEVVLFNLVTEK